MNRITIPLKEFLALTALMFCNASADAATVTYSDGDLFLGFRATGGTGATQTYLLNIGQASTYGDAAAGSSFTVNLGNVGTDLVSIYGNNWFNRADLFWGVGGAVSGAVSSDVPNTLYASREENPFGTLADPWNRRSNSAQGTTVSKIQGMASGYLNTGNSTANSNVGAVENTSDANNWASYQPGGANATGNISFGAYNPTVEGSFGGGVGATALDLFRMAPSTTTGLFGTYEGTFTISNNGLVRYDVIPEPSTLAISGIGTGLLGLVRRRRQPLSAHV